MTHVTSNVSSTFELFSIIEICAGTRQTQTDGRTDDGRGAFKSSYGAVSVAGKRMTASLDGQPVYVTLFTCDDRVQLTDHQFP